MVRHNLHHYSMVALVLILTSSVLTDDSYPLIVIDRAKDIKILDAGTYLNPSDNIFSSEIIPNPQNANGEFTYVTGYNFGSSFLNDLPTSDFKVF